nr:MAG: replication polyprotein [Owegonang virus 28]
MTTSDKSSRWSFTAYEGQYPLIDSLVDKPHELIAEIGYQDEVCPETQRKHRQGYVRTVRQVRFKQLSEVLRGVHIEVARDFMKLKQYCQKVATRDPEGQQVHKQFERPKTLHELMMWMADIAWQDYEDQDRQTDRHPSYPSSPPERKAQFVNLSATILMAKPEYVAILAQPIAKHAWHDYRAVWLQKALEIREGDNSITSPTQEEATEEIVHTDYKDGLEEYQVSGMEA